ncbi:hypothetical protein HPB52_000215 [Rhipicephalus sanguineus]|uniref:Uncharacterized protein n=1 Tax=Rhipicephalus sanguineus TaxID=34632 RepID=A0A9D4QHD3_RHISA|nr:hypothetical protein HPB52_000215 [Rhipicephalus sanguineus]
MDTRSTRRAASRTDADGPGVGNEAGADGAAETGGQQPSPGGTASSSRDPPVPLLETVRAWLQNLFAFVAPVRDALARTPPTAALPKLDVPTFTGYATGASITDFLDDLSVYSHERSWRAQTESSALLALLAETLRAGRGPGLPELPRPMIPCHQSGPLPQTGNEIL